MSMHPPRDPDELASDLVDGLLPEDEAARLRNDPAIAARVAAIEATRAALRVPPPSAPGAVDRAVAATFAALDQATLPTAVPPASPSPVSGERPPPPVAPLRSVDRSAGPWAPAHSRRADHSGQLRWLAAAAAIVLLCLVTVGLISAGSDRGDQSSSEDVAASAAPESEESSGAADDAATGEDEGTGAAREGDGAATPGDQPTAATEPGDSAGSADTTAPAEIPSTTGNQLGTVDSPAELADRIRAQRGSLDAPGGEGEGVLDGQSEAAEDGGSASACAGLTAAGDPARGEAVYVADAVYGGAPVLVHLYDDGSGQLQLVATNAACVDVVDTPYAR